MFEVVSEGRYSLMRIIDNPFFCFCSVCDF